MLTPIDIQNRTIKGGMGGYNKKDTDEFIAQILESFEAIYKENHDLKEKITSLSEGIQYYKKMENTLQKALVLAEKTSTETQEAAKKQSEAMLHEATAKSEAMLREATAKADTILNDAQTKSERIKAQANRELEDSRAHVRKLVQSYENYRLQFKKLAASQIEMLDSDAFNIYAPELDELVQGAPNADEAMESPSIMEQAIPSTATPKVTYEEDFEPVDKSTETSKVTYEEDFQTIDKKVQAQNPLFMDVDEMSKAPFLDLPDDIDDINSMITDNDTDNDNDLNLEDYEQLTDSDVSFESYEENIQEAEEAKENIASSEESFTNYFLDDDDASFNTVEPETKTGPEVKTRTPEFMFIDTEDEDFDFSSSISAPNSSNSSDTTDDDMSETPFTFID